MNYSIPHRRPLKSEEEEFLTVLFENSKPEWLPLVNKLTVIACCGCNSCPTILLGLHENDEPLSNQKILAELVGSDINNDRIDVVLFGNNSKPTELEFTAYGEYDLTKTPPLNWFVQQIKS